MPKCNLCGNTQFFRAFANLETFLEFDGDGALLNLRPKKIHPQNYDMVRFQSFQCHLCESLDVNMAASGGRKHPISFVSCPSCGYKVRLQENETGKRVQVFCPHCGYNFVTEIS